MMICQRVVIHGVVAIALAARCLAQGTFQNLSFEEAQIVPTGIMDYISPADAFPGWRSFIGTNEWGLAYYNTLTLDSPAVGLMRSNSPFVPAGLLVGQYCISLQYGLIPTTEGPTYASASIAQTGQMPADAQSLRFRATSPMYVTFNGTPIQMIVLRSYPDYDRYGADISALAGQTGELRISSYVHFNFLDNILLSNVPIPEPSIPCLFVLGAVLLFPRTRKVTSSLRD